jgi:hypothetical protein
VILLYSRRFWDRHLVTGGPIGLFVVVYGEVYEDFI